MRISGVSYAQALADSVIFSATHERMAVYALLPLTNTHNVCLARPRHGTNLIPACRITFSVLRRSSRAHHRCLHFVLYSSLSIVRESTLSSGLPQSVRGGNETGSQVPPDERHRPMWCLRPWLTTATDLPLKGYQIFPLSRFLNRHHVSPTLAHSQGSGKGM
jgi:hypothetical protein